MVFLSRNPKPYTLCPRKGFGLVEILIAAAIVGVALTSLAGVVASAFRVTDTDVSRVQASFLAAEGLEVARILRDAGWQENIAPRERGTPYYPVFNAVAGAWTLAEESPGAVDGVFTPTVVFDDVYRRTADDDIVLAGDPAPKEIDTGTIEVTSSVLWSGRAGMEETKVRTYLADIFGN